jgi:ABC-2 type transport system ATP-binding protein
MSAIETQALTKVFHSHGQPSLVAVDSLTLSVPEGIVFGYLGPNGAGKTTTIRMLTGVIPPSSGAGIVAGFPLTQPDHVKRHIGYANQAVSVYRDLTVAENLRFKADLFLDPRRVSRAVDEVMQTMGLTTRHGQLAGRLSGGWRQRLSIACAIVHSPRILFLDEPTAGLDPVGRRELWDAIYALAEAGTTVFVTTHYMDEAERCQRLAMIENGHVLAEGSPEHLRGGLSGHYYDLEVPDLAATMRQVLTLPQVRDAWITGASLRVSAREAIPAEQLAGFGAEARAVAPTLEDAFVALARKEVSA